MYPHPNHKLPNPWAPLLRCRIRESLRWSSELLWDHTKLCVCLCRIQPFLLGFSSFLSLYNLQLQSLQLPWLRAEPKMSQCLWVLVMSLRSSSRCQGSSGTPSSILLPFEHLIHGIRKDFLLYLHKAIVLKSTGSSQKNATIIKSFSEKNDPWDKNYPTSKDNQSQSVILTAKRDSFKTVAMGGKECSVDLGWAPGPA